MSCVRQGEEVEVPPPGDKARMVEATHAQLGHYGNGRTLSLLQRNFWWPAMARDVIRHVARCLQCDRVKGRVAEAKQELRSLPLVATRVRWSQDFAGNLPMSRRGHVYLLIMIDHAAKWVEAVGTANKTSEMIAAAFLSRVLARFGGCKEVLTDQGREFKGELKTLLDALGVRHRNSSRYSPQTDGLAEKMVSTLKEGLRKYAGLCDPLD